MPKCYPIKIAEQKNLPVKEATRPLDLQVLPRDIAKATKRNSKCCAFACAAKRELHVKDAYFLRTTAYLEHSDQVVRYKLPISMQKQIVAFDVTGEMHPGLYTLVAPWKVATLVGNRAAQKRSKRRAASNPRRVFKRRHSNPLSDKVRTMAEPVEV